ncbi:hypothetical protein VT06_16965, partial [Arsukibacterium sp. MJ3]
MALVDAFLAQVPTQITWLDILLKNVARLSGARSREANFTRPSEEVKTLISYFRIKFRNVVYPKVFLAALVFLVADTSVTTEAN